MRIRVMKSMWGVLEGGSFSNRLRRIRDAGYDGVECPAPDLSPREWADLLDRHGLQYVGVVSGDDAADVMEGLRHIGPYGPAVVVCYGGRDRMTFEEGCEFFVEVLKAEADTHIPVAHETHRQRLLYAPWVARDYLEEFPQLRLSADFSQWCVVSESLLDDAQPLVEVACRRAIHVRACFGHEQGPLAMDPRLAENQRYVDLQKSWWDKIVGARRSAGADELTFTPDYAPPEYIHALTPSTGQTSELWDISLWTAGQVRERWAR